MSLPVVNIISSDDEDSNSVHGCSTLDVNGTSCSNSQRELESNNEQTNYSHNNQSENEMHPLFKIIFRDEFTSRKYRRRIEDIIKYVLSSQVDKDNNNATTSDLVLEIYDSANQNNCSPSISCLTKNVDKFSNNVNSNKRKVENDIEPSSRYEKRSRSECKSQDNTDSSKYGQNDTDENDDISSIEMYQNMRSENHTQTSNFETCFENNSVKIGSYGYFIQDKSIFISKDGLTFFVPTFKGVNKQLKILSIELDEIIQVLIHFSETKPALFFLVSTTAAKEVRQLLNMNDPNGPFLDPDSKDVIHHHIAILPEKISNKSKSIMKELFKNKVTVEINEKVADSFIHGVVITKIANENLERFDVVHETVETNMLCTNNEIINDRCIEETNMLSSDTNTNNNLNTTFLCNIVRIGTYEYAKKRVFSISKTGLKFCAPVVNNDSTIVTLSIHIDDIVKFAISFSETFPVIFLYISTKAGVMIREMLCMRRRRSGGPYFDPNDRENANKIVILPKKLSKESEVIKDLLKLGKIEEINDVTANEILSKSVFRKGKCKKKWKKKYAIQQTDNLCVCLLTTCVNIGIYKCAQLGLNTMLSPIGIQLNLPLIRKSSDYRTINLGINEITAVSFHLSNHFNVIFFNLTDFGARNIRTTLGISENDYNNVGPHYDPNNKSGDKKRLMIIFKQPPVKHVEILKKILRLMHSLEMRIDEARCMIQKQMPNRGETTEITI